MSEKSKWNKLLDDDDPVTGYKIKIDLKDDSAIVTGQISCPPGEDPPHLKSADCPNYWRSPYKHLKWNPATGDLFDDCFNYIGKAEFDGYTLRGRSATTGQEIICIFRKRKPILPKLHLDSWSMMKLWIIVWALAVSAIIYFTWIIPMQEIREMLQQLKPIR